MLTREVFDAARRRAAAMIRESGIPIRDEEPEKIEVADFGLSDLEHEGAQILTLVATGRMAVKVLVLFPSQTLPEHWHPPVGDDPGKEETVRVVQGEVRVYEAGAENVREGFIPKGKENSYSVRHETIAKTGDQITFTPGAKHWFQAGEDGAVAFSFSTVARDILDEFTDPDIERTTKVQD